MSNTHKDQVNAELLSWDVFVTPGIPIVMSDMLPAEENHVFRRWRRPHPWQAGRRAGGCLHDEPQANALADWIAAKGKT